MIVAEEGWRFSHQRIGQIVAQLHFHHGRAAPVAGVWMPQLDNPMPPRRYTDGSVASMFIPAKWIDEIWVFLVVLGFAFALAAAASQVGMKRLARM